MSGIVERLRKLNPWCDLDWPEVIREAEGEIERLRNELSTARRTALLEAAEIAEDRAPVVQCMSVEPIVEACLDIAASIRKLAEEA